MTMPTSSLDPNTSAWLDEEHLEIRRMVRDFALAEVAPHATALDEEKRFPHEVIPKLAQRGVRKLAVFCPAFVADCLETLEEIGMRAQEDFRQAGGETLELIPSLNSEPAWIEGLEMIIRESLPRPGRLPVIAQTVAVS